MLYFFIFLLLVSNLFAIEPAYDKVVNSRDIFSRNGFEYEIKIDQNHKKARIISNYYEIELDEDECNEIRNLRFCFVSASSGKVFALESDKPYARPFNIWIKLLAFLGFGTFIYSLFLIFRSIKKRNFY